MGEMNRSNFQQNCKLITLLLHLYASIISHFLVMNIHLVFVITIHRLR